MLFKNIDFSSKHNQDIANDVIKYLSLIIVVVVPINLILWYLFNRLLALLLPCCIAAGVSPFMTWTTTLAESVMKFKKKNIQFVKKISNCEVYWRL